MHDVKLILECLVGFLAVILGVYILVRVAGTAWFLSKKEHYKSVLQEKTYHE